MPYGLRVWNSAGALILDISDRNTRFEANYFTAFSAGNGPQTQYINVAGINNVLWYATSDNWHIHCTVENDRIKVEKYLTTAAVNPVQITLIRV